MKTSTKSAAALFALASVGAMNSFFQKFTPRMPKIKGSEKRNWMTPHEGARQAERQRRQGLHMKTVNGFELIQARPSKERAFPSVEVPE